MSVLNVYVSIPALQIGSSVPFLPLYLPFLKLHLVSKGNEAFVSTLTTKISDDLNPSQRGLIWCC